MTFSINLRPEAESDLTEAATWYERQRPGLGHEFLDAITLALNDIGEAPLSFPAIYRDVRRTVIRRFPFGIFFRIANESILIIAVIHASRNPGRWKGRS